jgi:hypothetical protein
MNQHKSRKSGLKKNIRRLVAGLLLAPLLWIFYVEAGRAISYLAIRQVARLTNTSIKTGSIEFQTDGSVFIEQLVISPKKQKSRDTIFQAKTVYARFKLASLLLLQPRLKFMDVDNFVFNAQYDMDTGWSNLSGIKITPPKGHAGKMPRILLKNGTLQYSKISNGQSQIAISVPLNASFGLNEEPNEGYKFEITTSTMSSGHGKSRLNGFWKPGIVTVAGGISSIDVPELEMIWFIDVLAAEFKYDQNDDFTLTINMPDLQSRRSAALDRLASVGPAFLGKTGLFTALQGFLDRYQPQGLVDIRLDVSGNMGQLSKSKLAGKVLCKDVAFGYYKFPYTIDHLTGQIDFTKNSVNLNNLCGKHGDANFFFNGWASDFGPDRKYQIQITSDNMPLDTDLYEALNEKQKKFWSAFSPLGHAGVDLQLSRQSKTDKQIRLELELLGAEAVYRNFPYRLQNLAGKLLFSSNNIIFSNIISQINDRKITLNGLIDTTDTDKPITYDFTIKVNNIPFDTSLQAALTNKQKNLYEQLKPAGLTDGWIKISRQDSGPAGYTADLSFKNASLKLDQFPLPVSDVTAKALFTSHLIVIKEFSGLYCDDSVSLSGHVYLDQEYRQSNYHLVLKLERTQLDNHLFDLMPDSLKKIVTELKPEGSVNLTADFNKESLTKPPDYGITLECLHNNVTIPKFPYPLKDITGTLITKDNSIKLKDITAITDSNVPKDLNPPTIKLNGEIILTNDTYDSIILNLSAKDLIFDDRLALALPQNVRPLYGRLSPAGRFDLDFDKIRISPTDNGRKSIDFDGTVDFINSSINVSGTTIELNAPLETKGTYKTGEGFSNCQNELNGGTLKILGKTFTNLKGNICYDFDSRYWSTQDFIADFYGGKLNGSFEFKQPAEQAEQYVLQTGFENVDLKRFLSDTTSGRAPENGHTSGTMTGSLSLNASLGDNSSRVGSCRLSISNMQVGKLSPLAKVLQVLQLSGPENYAFDRMYVDSFIQRNSLFVRKLDLSGRNIAFYGSGTMDLKSRNVNMALISRGKRLATEDPSLLQSLTEGLGQGMVRMDVTGDLYDPKITTKTMPVIEQTLQIFGTIPGTRN